MLRANGLVQVFDPVCTVMTYAVILEGGGIITHEAFYEKPFNKSSHAVLQTCQWRVCVSYVFDNMAPLQSCPLMFFGTSVRLTWGQEIVCNVAEYRFILPF